MTVPFTHPPEPLNGILVTGFGGPRRPEIVPLAARNAILTSHPDLRVSRHPSDLQDFAAATATLSSHVEEIADVCPLALELEPDLGLLCVDFMSSDIAGHLMWHRLDPAHPAHRAGEAGDELVQIYEAVDAACGRLVEEAEWLWDEPPTVFVLSDHGMKPTHWLFRANRWLEDAGYLRFRKDATARTGTEPAAYAPELEDALVDEQPPFAEIDFGKTRAYCFGYGGQIYLGEVTGAEEDRGLADELAEALAQVVHPESGEPAFDVRRKEELYHGFYLDQRARARPPTARRARPRRLDPPALARDVPAPRAPLRPGRRALLRVQHAVTGILAAAGPREYRRREAVPPGAGHHAGSGHAARAMHGLAAPLDASPIETILDAQQHARAATGGPTGNHRIAMSSASGYTPEEPDRIVRAPS